MAPEFHREIFGENLRGDVEKLQLIRPMRNGDRHGIVAGEHALRLGGHAKFTVQRIAVVRQRHRDGHQGLRAVIPAEPDAGIQRQRLIGQGEPQADNRPTMASRIRTNRIRALLVLAIWGMITSHYTAAMRSRQRGGFFATS